MGFKAGVDPRAVQLFLSICREGTISGAARAENLSQPAVSIAMAQLERRLGAKLFERHRSGIRLLPAGHALQERGKVIESVLEAAEREAQLINAGVAGPLVIAGTPGALATIVPRVVATLRRDFPRFELQVLERSDSAILDLLTSHGVDLAVVTVGMEKRPDRFEERAIGSDPFALIVGRENDHLPDEVSLHDLADAAWVLPEIMGTFRRQIDALFVSAEFPLPDNVIRCDSLLTTKEIVRSTNYVTVLPREVAMAEVSIGALRSVRIREARVERKVGLLWLRERTPAHLARAFIDHAGRVDLTG